MSPACSLPSGKLLSISRGAAGMLLSKLRLEGMYGEETVSSRS